MGTGSVELTFSVRKFSHFILVDLSLCSYFFEKVSTVIFLATEVQIFFFFFFFNFFCKYLSIRLQWWRGKILSGQLVNFNFMAYNSLKNNLGKWVKPWSMYNTRPPQQQDLLRRIWKISNNTSILFLTIDEKMSMW